MLRRCIERHKAIALVAAVLTLTSVENPHRIAHDTRYAQTAKTEEAA
jgi:hypothetical protein